jgi:sugar lactone lactonase YvrE
MKRASILLSLICLIVLLSCKKGTPDSKSDSNLSISSIDPTTGGDNTVIAITGKNFSTNIQLDTVRINGKIATIVAATADTIRALIPIAAGSGSVTVTVNGITAVGQVFNYIQNLIVSTVAGNGVGDHLNGASTISPINYPFGIALDIQGNLYVAEYNRIKKIAPDGNMTVLAGSGARGYFDTTVGIYAQFSPVNDVAVDFNGNIFVADRDNACIRKITPEGHVSTFAGSKTYGYADGAGPDAKFWEPYALTVDLHGNVYVSDRSNYRIRKITPAGIVSTLAGDGNQGYRDGPGNQAEFFQIAGITTDPQGNLYVAEEFRSRIRKITPSGEVSTLAGSQFVGYADGTAANAQFSKPTGVAVDNFGNVYVTDHDNEIIRKITPAGIVTTLAGTPEQQGFADGPAATAKFYAPQDLVVDNQGNIYVADCANHRIRKISTQ